MKLVRYTILMMFEILLLKYKELTTFIDRSSLFKKKMYPVHNIAAADMLLHTPCVYYSLII